MLPPAASIEILRYHRRIRVREIFPAPRDLIAIIYIEAPEALYDAMYKISAK